MAKKQPMYGSEASVDNDNIPSLDITWTANEPVADDTITVADGAVLGEQTTNPTEVGIIVATAVAKLNAIITALENYGILDDGS